MIVYIFILILLLVILVFFSVVKNSLTLLKQEKNEDHNFQNFGITVLVVKYLLEIVFITLSILFLLNEFELPAFYILLVVSIVILLFVEIFPLYIPEKIAEQILDLSKPVIKIISVALFPVVSLILKFSNRSGLLQNLLEQNISINLKVEGNKTLIKRKYQTGFMDKNQNDILNNIVELGDRRIYEAMRPRTEIVGVEINGSVEEVLDVFIKSGYSKIPVYEENLDNIKGIVLANDFFHHPTGITEVIRDVIFVPETKKCADMLKEFSEKRISFAVAVDEFGGTAGILTMEDILEELFGEIKDEYDTDDIICKKIADNTYIIGGKVEIGYINETLNLNIPPGDYSTIAGFITFHAGKIPDKGDNIQIDNFKINILRSNQMRIELVKVVVFSPAN